MRVAVPAATALALLSFVACDISFIAVEDLPPSARLSVQAVQTDALRARVTVDLLRGATGPVYVDGLLLEPVPRGAVLTHAATVALDSLQPELGITIGPGPEHTLALHVPARWGPADRTSSGGFRLPLHLLEAWPDQRWTMDVVDSADRVLVRLEAVGQGAPVPSILPAEMVPSAAVGVRLVINSFTVREGADYPLGQQLRSELTFPLPDRP